MIENMTKKVSVVVPVYFNAPSLPELFNRLDNLNRELLRINLELEVVAVDDGSKDDSFEILVEYSKKYSFLNAFQLTKNFGEATASKFGLKKITGDAFSVLAADLQDPPELIFEMAKNWLEGDSYVICERTKRNDPIFSKFLANLYYKFLTKFIMPTYPKKGFDLFLMDAKYLPVIIESSKSSSIPLILSWIGIEPLKIGYVRQTREHGKSTWTIFKRINLLLDVLFSFSRKPIRIVSSIGAVTALAGLIYGIWVIIERLNGATGSQGTASLIALVSFTSGLVLLTLGIIAEYIWRIWDEVNNRPDGIEKFKN
jgi:glycosyltransferase involved in cell wall biosynthesis